MYLLVFVIVYNLSPVEIRRYVAVENLHIGVKAFLSVHIADVVLYSVTLRASLDELQNLFRFASQVYLVDCLQGFQPHLGAKVLVMRERAPQPTLHHLGRDSPLRYAVDYVTEERVRRRVDIAGTAQGDSVLERTRVLVFLRPVP